MEVSAMAQLHPAPITAHPTRNNEETGMSWELGQRLRLFDDRCNS